MIVLEEQRYHRVKKLEERIGYRFEDRALVIRALTHSSYGDGQGSTLDNERLEFLGDRVLGLLTAQALFEYSAADEGTLARRLNALVRKEMCAKIAQTIGLGECLLISPAEERQGGRTKKSILGDTCEALLAAIYVDGGLVAVQQFYDSHWMPEFHRVVSRSAIDPKTKLQERAMADGKGLPHYSLKDRSGPDHDPVFTVEVTVSGVGSAIGAGGSKRAAERVAAAKLNETWT